MAVKVPPLLHKMSLSAQKAWYKKHGMEMPSTPAAGGKSAAQAKKDVGEINKKKAREAAIAAAAATSKKNKELMKSSDRVRQMAANVKAFGGQRPGGDLTTASGMVNFIRSGGYLKAGRLGEAAKPDASMAMTDTLKMKMISDKDKRTLGKVAALMASQKNKDKKNAYVRQLGLKAMKAGEVDPARGHSPTRFGREVLRKEEFESIDEVTKKEAEKTLGGPVKEKPTMPPGKQPAGYRYVRGLARKAMKAGLKKEEVEINEAIKDAADVGEYDYEGDMAKSQLRSILTNAKRLHDMLEDQTNLPEWVQSKITLAEDYILTAANYMEGEMNEEAEQVDEKINLVKAKMGDVIKDFQKSDAPQFKGKSMAKRREMAVAAKLGAEREAGMREEVEQIDEQSPAEIKAKYYHDQFNKVKPVKAYDKEGKLVGRYRSMDHAKQMKPGHTYKVEEGVVTEAEGKVAVTPKEKALAAHHGDKTRITFGDVLKARLKSAAEKAMKKGN